MYTIVGLGNPGTKYVSSRHNVGRMVLERLAKTCDFDAWKKSNVQASYVAKGVIGDEKVTLIMPETFMNTSGFAVKKFAGAKKKIAQLIVVHDDLDLPVGSLRIGKNRGAGGHKGVASIIASLKSKDFIRVRVGVAPVTPSGKIKKPHGEDEVCDFVLGTFKKKEKEVVDARVRDSVEALQVIVAEGIETAMRTFNQ